MEGESGEQVGGELVSVSSSAECLCKAGGMRQGVEEHSEMSDW